MVVEKTRTGMIVIYESVNGQMLIQQYLGYTKREAISKFKKLYKKERKIK